MDLDAEWQRFDVQVRAAEAFWSPYGAELQVLVFRVIARAPVLTVVAAVEQLRKNPQAIMVRRDPEHQVRVFAGEGESVDCGCFSFDEFLELAHDRIEEVT